MSAGRFARVRVAGSTRAEGREIKSVEQQIGQEKERERDREQASGLGAGRHMGNHA